MQSILSILQEVGKSNKNNSETHSLQGDQSLNSLLPPLKTSTLLPNVHPSFNVFVSPNHFFHSTSPPPSKKKIKIKIFSQKKYQPPCPILKSILPYFHLLFKIYPIPSTIQGWKTKLTHPLKREGIPTMKLYNYHFNFTLNQQRTRASLN